MKEIDDKLYADLVHLGIINEENSEFNNVRTFNVGTSNYCGHIIQPWSIWLDWNLNPWDADIIKRVLRTKEGTSRKEDYEKICHICMERIRQIKTKGACVAATINFEDVE